MVEFSITFPVLALVALGTVDVSYLLYEWNAAGKATQMGVRKAVVVNPAAMGITNLVSQWNADHIGDSCLTATGGQASYCPTVNAACTSTTCGSYGLDAEAFNLIVAEMQLAFPRIQPQNVQISYKTTGLGFVGRPGGLPMTVTVNLRCMTHQFYFLGGLMQWIAPAAPSGCSGTPAGWPIPPSATTLISEDLQTVTAGI